ERLLDPEAERIMGLVVDVAVAIRGVRAEYNVKPRDVVEVVVRAEGATRAALDAVVVLIERTASARLTFVDALPDRARSARAVVGAELELMVPLEGLIDVAAEKARGVGEAGRGERGMEGLPRKGGTAVFAERAPADVVEGVRARLAEETTRAERLRAAAGALT